MTRSALPRDTRRSLIWLALLVVALLGRAAAPEGWMTVASAAGGIEVTICDGQGPMPVMVMAPDGSLHKKLPTKSPASDHPCAFAGMAVADTAPMPASLAALTPTASSVPSLARSVAAPGRGLAAPPPPATGPPALT